MGFSLAPGISFCEVTSQRIFLDINRDRYFCLGHAANTAFDGLVAGNALTENDLARLSALETAGILVEGASGERPRRCREILVESSALDHSPGRTPRTLAVLGAIFAIRRAKRELRAYPLSSVLGELADAKQNSSIDARAASATRLGELALAFAAAGRVVATLNHCLPTSVAILRRCVRIGISANLCLGVKLQPFEAHAWVVSGTTVISDRIQVVRSFSPILVI